MNKQASSIPAVDLVIVIDTSPSMKDEAQALSDAAEKAIARLFICDKSPSFIFSWRRRSL
ncbi:hypothetical protein [uncultured Nostoc sp.]|uniref:hypothetical protein n=1 Tax=uncultured Nostoc sp. TaxID=340711 RepID=UPI0035CB61F9